MKKDKFNIIAILAITTLLAFPLAMKKHSVSLPGDFRDAVASSSPDTAGFDGSGGGSLSDSVRSLKEQSKNNADIKMPVPSTPTPSHEISNFWDNLRTNGVEKVCKAAQIQLSQNYTLESVAGLGGGVRRTIKAYPDEKLALVDEIQLKLSAGLKYEVLPIAGYGSINVGISGSMEGNSIVVRPLKHNRYCQELGTLVELYKMKTVLPITAKRIAKMEKREIWKLPMSVSYTFSAGVGASFNQLVTVSVSGGETKARKPMVSLYRIDENTLRLRLRLDHVTIKTVGAQVHSMDIPVSDIGLPGGEDLISKTVDREIARQINRLIAFKLAYSHIWTGGQKLLVEFYLNPNDAEQMDRLVEFLEGDFTSIKKFIQMGLKFESFSENADGLSGADDLEQIGDQAGSAIGVAPSFAGSDHYDGHSSNFNLNVPIIYSQSNSWKTGSHRYQSLKDKGAVIYVQERARVADSGSINIPIIGAQFKHNSQKNIYVVNRETADGKVSKPVMFYQKYEGFVRDNDISARGMIDGVNDVLKYAGMKGEGTTNENMLSSAGIFPPALQGPPVRTSPHSQGESARNIKIYRAAVVAFKLVFSEKAVQDIIFAAPNLIMKAYMNVMRETHAAILSKVMDLFRVNEKGKVDFDSGAARKRLNIDAIAGHATNPLDIVRTLAGAATSFIKSIMSLKNASGWKEQSEQLAKVSATGGMKYDDFMKVVIQMVDPKDISSELYIHTDKRVKGETDVTQTYDMFNNGDHNYNKTISDVTQMRERFNDPASLSD